MGSKQNKWVARIAKKGGNECRREQKGEAHSRTACAWTRPHLSAVALGLDIGQQICLDQNNKTVDPELHMIYEDFTFSIQLIPFTRELCHG